MHIVDTKSGNSSTTTKAKALKVDQMDDEAIQCKMNRCLEESVRALSKAMIDSNGTTILLLSQGLI